MRRLPLLPFIPLFPLLLFSALPVNSQPVNSKIRFPQTQNRGAPPVTTGAGTRGETCLLNDNSILFALGPSTTAPTVAPNPTILVYLPEHRAKTGSLNIIDREGREVYQGKVSLPATPGILAIPLPETLDLGLNQTYVWKFTVVCSSKFAVGATVKNDLTEINLQRRPWTPPSDLPALERAQVYADQGLWLDVLATLAPLREQELETWTALLDYLQFGEFADREIVFLSIPPQ